MDRQSEDMDNDVGGVDEDLGTGQTQEEGEFEGANAVLDSTTTAVEMDEEVVQFSVSHESVKSNIRTLRRPNEEPLGEGVTSGNKKSWAFRDVTNNLSSRTGQTKPNEFRPNTALGPKNQAGGFNWASTEAIINKPEVDYLHKLGDNPKTQLEQVISGLIPPWHPDPMTHPLFLWGKRHLDRTPPPIPQMEEEVVWLWSARRWMMVAMEPTDRGFNRAHSRG